MKLSKFVLLGIVQSKEFGVCHSTLIVLFYQLSGFLDHYTTSFVSDLVSLILVAWIVVIRLLVFLLATYYLTLDLSARSPYWSSVLSIQHPPTITLRSRRRNLCFTICWRRVVLSTIYIRSWCTQHFCAVCLWLGLVFMRSRIAFRFLTVTKLIFAFMNYVPLTPDYFLMVLSSSMFVKLLYFCFVDSFRNKNNNNRLQVIPQLLLITMLNNIHYP
jgi:hypothetical protein